MCDRCDQGSDNGNGDNVVTCTLYQPSHNHIKQSGIGKYSEVNNGKDKQNTVAGRCLDSVCDESHDIHRGKSKNQRCNRRHNCQNNDR